MRTVDDLIASKPRPENIIKPDALVIDALHLLEQVNLSYLIVMDGDAYKGVFSEKDYSRNVVLKGRSSKEAHVQEVMTTDLPVVGPEETVEHCMILMIRSKARYLVAIDEKKFMGIITIHDILREVLANREEVFDDTLAEELIKTAEGRGRIY
ncbi:CBS domain-containing protein [Niastella koreensis]|jgi:predicted transcriptional regulator|uniref:CBS domain containing protein n=2 Tax=Niastella koreensis TaxID=354356 RepID=G8TGS1_NIAKG|nr:CBS domain-containing protein [Niastella koreensis]AEV98513.1 CBS domain containing protein [Niastella koreensis GR20-10]OQP53043.1 CBS domain-containing protein [Niastella koreensis]